MNPKLLIDGPIYEASCLAHIENWSIGSTAKRHFPGLIFASQFSPLLKITFPGGISGSMHDREKSRTEYLKSSLTWECRSQCLCSVNNLNNYH